MNPIHPIPIRWTPSTQHLNQDSTLLSRIGNLFWNVISVVVFVIGFCRLIGMHLAKKANKMALPAAYFSEDRKIAAERNFAKDWEAHPEVQKHFVKEEHRVETPDKIKLCTTLFRHTKASKETPTVVYFCCSGQLSTETPALLFLEKMIDLGIVGNFVVWDYRGVGRSEGQFAGTRDLVLDGSSIVQWVNTQVTTDPANIHSYGLSLGGAISALIHDITPTGRIVNDRSFASSGKILETRLGKGIKTTFITQIFNMQGYSADPYAVLSKKVKANPKSVLVIANPKEEVIHYSASMAKALEHSDRVIQLEIKDEDELKSNHEHQFQQLMNYMKSAIKSEELVNKYLQHAGPLFCFKDKEGNDQLEEQVLRFLFGCRVV